MNGFRLLLVAALVVAVTALSWGGISYAQQAPAEVKPAVEKDPAAAKRKADAAIRARAQRDAAIKKRHETKKYIQKVVEGQQSGAATPDNAGKGGAK
jgi:hypothetical protein